MHLVKKFAALYKREVWQLVQITPNIDLILSQYNPESEKSARSLYHCGKYKGTVTDYATGWTVWGSNPGRGKIFFSSPKVHALSGSPHPCIQWLPGFFLGGKVAGGLTLTTHLHLAPTLRMSRAVRPLPLYAFLAWTGKALPLDEQKNVVMHDKTSVARVPTFNPYRTNVENRVSS